MMLEDPAAAIERIYHDMYARLKDLTFAQANRRTERTNGVLSGRET